jgi:hypothetical protein
MRSRPGTAPRRVPGRDVVANAIDLVPEQAADRRDRQTDRREAAAVDRDLAADAPDHLIRRRETAMRAREQSCRSA